jgi:hypothetical protein
MSNCYWCGEDCGATCLSLRRSTHLKKNLRSSIMCSMREEIETNLPLVNTITLMRIYDVLMGIYSNINEEEAMNMVKMHEEGIFATPDPVYLEPKEAKDDIHE